MLGSLRARMSLLFLAFFALLSVSAAATAWVIATQEQDALVVNLAGRQRMLVKQMTSDSLRIEYAADQAAVQSLAKAAETFDQTLAALIHGGTAHYPPGRVVDIPTTKDRAPLIALEELEATWSEFGGHVEGIVSGRLEGDDRASAFQAIEDVEPVLSQQADEVVRQYQAVAARKIGRVQAIQAVFFVGALALLIAGLLLTQRAVVRPLRRLSQAAERIRGSDLTTPTEVQGPQEIQSLARSFEAMRADLAASHHAQQAWTGDLERRVAQRTRELAALQEVSREITSQLEIRHVLQSVTDKARTLLGADAAALCLLEPGERYLQSSASSGPAEAVLGGRVSALHQLTERVLSSEGALLCATNESPGCCGILAEPYLLSHLVAPLRIGPRVLGSLCVGGKGRGQFDGEARHLLTELANSAAIAMENARLYEQAERAATLEERQRIAAEMHDGLAQTVSYLGLQVDQAVDLLTLDQVSQATEQLHALRTAIEQASMEVRKGITRLQQDVQPAQALQERLAQLVVDQAREGEPTVEFTERSAEPLILQHDVCEEIQRVVGEALLNARRHAGAGRIWLRLLQSEGEVTVTVEDDGRGFDPAALVENTQHFGLSIMRARAARLGGRLAVDSGPGQGTRVTLAWSLKGE